MSEGEIKKAIFHKAPGTDGFPPNCFQRYWNILGSSVVQFVQSTFRTRIFPQKLNETLICLIPKVESPEKIGQFRPISLCNVLINIITKILANRLKLIMKLLVGPNQSSFIP